jgi:parallel beta-helix repeat protein
MKYKLDPLSPMGVSAAQWSNLVSVGGSGTVNDATEDTKGKLQLSGDLGGTAASPTVKSRTVTRVVGTVVGQSADHICTGVADDVQINAALAEVLALGGGTVLLRAGEYVLDSTLLIGSNMRLEGESTLAELIIPSGEDFNAIQNINTTTGNSNIVIANLAVNGTIAGTHSSEKAGINLLRVTDSLITGCLIYDIYGMGIWINEATDSSGESDHSVVSNNIVKNCYHHNITIDSGSGTISGNVCDTTVLYDNIQVDSIKDVTVTGNVCKNAGRNNIMVHSNGGTTLAAIENTVTGNICRGAGGANIVFTADGAGEYAPRNIASSNQCHDATSDAIRIVRAPNTVVSSNIARSSGRYGIWVNDSDGTVVSSNQSIEHLGLSGRGVYIQESDNCMVLGNECSGNSQQGIELLTSLYCTVSTNVANDNGNINIRLQDSDHNSLMGNSTSGARIQINNSDYNTIVGNQSNDGVYGIQEVGTSDFNIITGNVAQGNSTANYAVLGTNTEAGLNIGF